MACSTQARTPDGDNLLDLGKGGLGFLQLAITDLPTTGARSSSWLGSVGIDLSVSR